MDFKVFADGRLPSFSARTEKRFSLRTVGFLCLAFIVSGCTLFGEIMPFGAALYAAAYLASPPLSLAAVSVFAALFPHFLPMVAIKYVLSLLLFSFLAGKHGESILKTPLRRGSVMGGCVFAAGLFMLLGGQILLYDCFLLVLEAAITTAAVCLFANARRAFSEAEVLSSPMDVLSVSALAGVAILGISNIVSITGLYLTTPLSVLAVLLLTHESGMTSGALAGITLGLLATLESGDPVLGAFAAAGMAAGYFARYGRAGSALAFIFANAAVTYYTGGSSEMVLHISEMVAPSLIYLALPPGLLGHLTTPADTTELPQSRTKTFLANELREKAEAFSFLSCTLQSLAENAQRGTQNAAASFFEKAARHACEGCKKLDFCWKREFHRTYASLFVMLEICCREGKVTRDDIPISLQDKCIRPLLLLDAFNHTYEAYRIDMLWETRTREARSLVARQLSSVSHILEVMEKNVRSGLSENSKMEDLIRAHLREQHIMAEDVTALERRRGTLSVSLSCDPEIPPAEIADAVSEALKMPMEVVDTQNGRIRLAPPRHIYLEICGETRMREGSQKSGDSFESLYLDSGHYLLAISDGMGSGARAAEDSRAALSMLRALFSAGFDAETAVGLVNSVLVLKSAEETFATLDLLLVNTRSLEAEFMKAGAAASFIRHGKTVRTFSAGSLPAGLLSKPDLASLHAKLSPGDMIVMLSDGALDPALRAEDGAWVSEAIANYEGDDPSALMQIILQLAKEKGGGHVRDDMTVICAAVRRPDDFVA